MKYIYSLQVQFGCLVIGEWGQLEKCCRIRNRRRSQKQKQEYLGPWGTIPWRSSKSVFSDGEEPSSERITMQLNSGSSPSSPATVQRYNQGKKTCNTGNIRKARWKDTHYLTKSWYLHHIMFNCSTPYYNNSDSYTYNGVLGRCADNQNGNSSTAPVADCQLFSHVQSHLNYYIYIMNPKLSAKHVLAVREWF